MNIRFATLRAADPAGAAPLRRQVAAWRTSPVSWILLLAAAFRIVGIAWGLPASDGWDDDGIAPRDILVGVIETYWPGHFYIYPPLQFILLTILTGPVSIIALLHAPSLSQHGLISTFIQVPYMTVFAFVARIVSAAMSLGTIWLTGKMAEQIAGERAGWCASAACALEATLTYYGHVTNLDGPYLFWSALSLWWWMRALAGHDPRAFRWAALFAAAAIATKDQAYALFVPGIPAVFVFWFAADSWPRRNWRRVAPPLLLWGGAALLLLLALDGAITNPSGFAQRLAYLTGPASGDFAFYPPSWPGRLALLRDMWSHFPHSYPIATALFGTAGVFAAVHRTRRDPARMAAAVLPLFAICSFILAFNFVALRSEERFVLPKWVFASVYIGIAIDWLAFSDSPLLRIGSRTVLAPLAAYALFECASIDAAFLGDPRYDAEQWLAGQVTPGQTIEIYGQNCYLPRLPQGAIMTRVDSKPLVPRNPQIDVTEVSAPFEDVARRNPDFILVPSIWIEPYLIPSSQPPAPGQAYSRRQQQIFARTGARAYFARLNAGKTQWRLVHESVHRSWLWPTIHLHESLDESIRIYRRSPQAVTANARNG